MASFTNHYACSECGNHWIDEWSCACDDRCPNCNTPISPYFYHEHEDEDDIEAVADEETEEEHAVRLQRISEEVKADMAAGRYRYGQLRPDVTAKKKPTELEIIGFDPWQRDIMKQMMEIDFAKLEVSRFRKLMETSDDHKYSGLRFDQMVMDEMTYIKSDSLYLGHFSKDFTEYEPEKTGQEKDGPKKLYWSQPIPDPKAEKPVSSPSEELRAKRRAKRKKRK
ncbi:MAG: hypothetical protein LC687_06575 [Actinobacteria bacterium]|nr:hypothetical protein [Actinomycetota bacterium]MCA1807493.1 hypothetical protein [Actinomycetota bacterium]